MIFGVMQGRLLPSFKSQYQAHPVTNWKHEFELASNNKIQSIEFIVDSYLYHANPIITTNGIEEIKDVINKTGIKVKSICADIFMQWPLKEMDIKEISIYGEILQRLVSNLSELGGTDIVLPFVDHSSLKKKEDMTFVSSFLDDFEETCIKSNINLSLETDLEPNQFASYLSTFKNNRVTVNYDSGNSASLGYLFEEEIRLYGERISNIHIKDRKRNGGPVLLGRGDAELVKVKNFINNNYKGLVIFQAFRDENPILTFQKQLDYFIKL